jgi:hypothetical protein
MPGRTRVSRPSAGEVVVRKTTSKSFLLAGARGGQMTRRSLTMTSPEALAHPDRLGRQERSDHGNEPQRLASVGTYVRSAD